MRSILLITFLDYIMEENQRPHHLARFFGGKVKRMVVLSRAEESVDLRGWEDIRSLFRSRLQVLRQARLVVLRVTPPLNYRPGFGMRLMGCGGVADPSGMRGVKSIGGSLLRKVGLVRHFIITPALLLGFLFAGDGRYDVCLVEGAWGGVVGVLLRKVGKVGFLVYEDIDYWGGEGRTLLEKILAALERFSLNQADLRISSSELLGELRRAQLGKEVQVVTNGVELSLFRSSQEKVDHPPTLVYIGVVLDWSGLDLVISALPLIGEQVPDVRLTIIGRVAPAYETQLRRHAKITGVERRVVFMGLRPHHEIPELLSTCDIGLATFKPIPFRRFAFPLKVMEYLAAGLPVIGTTGTETERILARGPCGEVVEHRVEPFARAVVSLLTDHERYQGYAENAVRESARYEWDHLLEREYQLVDKAYREHRGGLS
jgi:glycosyltransferase involved in cell wall biosynthesis